MYLLHSEDVLLPGFDYIKDMSQLSNKQEL